jgi:hypothetical protein
VSRETSESSAGRLALPILGGALAAFAGLLSGGVLYFRDISLLHRPVRHLVRESWGQGSLPLLDPVMDGGRHLLANPNHRVLHPTALLDLFLGLDQAFAVATVLQIFLAGWGLALLLRREGAGLAAARIGGLAFALSGPVLSLGNLPNLLAGMAWVPWIILAGRRAQARPSHGLPAAMALAAVPLFAGGVESVGTALLVLGFMALGSPHRRRALAVTGAVAGGAVLLAGLTLLPALATLRGSERGLGFRPEQLFYWSLSPHRLLEFLIPGLWGVATDPSRWWGGARFDGGIPLMLSGYMGATVLALAVAGVLSIRPIRREGSPSLPVANRLPGDLNHLMVAMLATGGVLLFLALGHHNPLLLLGGELPIAGAMLRFPERLLPLIGLPVAVAAAAGWQVLTSGNESPGRPSARSWLILALTGAPLLAVNLAALAGRVPLTGNLPEATRPQAAAALTGTTGMALVCVALLGVCFWLASRAATRRLAGGCVAAVVALDLLLAGAGLNPTADQDILTEVPQVVEKIVGDADNSSPPRILRLQEPPIAGEEIPPGVEVAWSRRSLAYRIPEELGLSTCLMSDVDRATPLGNAFLRMAYQQAVGPNRERLADRAAAGWEIGFADSPETIPADAVWAGAVFPRAPLLVLRQRTSAAPRIHVVPEADWLGDLTKADVLGEVVHHLADPDIDPRRRVILTGRAGEEIRGEWDPGQAVIRRLVDRPTELALEVELPGPGVLVVRDSFVDGWHLQVDGRVADMVRADLAWRGVVLPAGIHQVRFIYRQPGLLAGAAMSGSGVLLCGGLLLVRLRRRRPVLQTVAA